MLFRAIHHYPHYFQCHLKKKLEELYISVGIQDLALAMVMLFEPVYLYRLEYSISEIALFYATVYAAFILLVPFGGKMVARYGATKSISLSTVFLVLYYIGLISIADWPIMFWAVPFLCALQKSFYWPGYHRDFIAVSNKKERGKEFSGLYSVTTLMYIIGPIIGGLIIKTYGFSVLFIAGSLLIFVSNVPLLIEREKIKKQSFSYWSCFSLPFRKMHLRTTLAYMGMGEQLLNAYIWPIFLYITFRTVLEMGTLTALATLITAIITLGLGRMFDHGQWRKAYQIGSAMTVFNWVARPFLQAVSPVFYSDTIARISSNMTFVTMSDVAYQRAVKEKNILPRAIMLEQGLSYGKMLAAILLAVLAGVWPPFTATFVLGAVFSVLYFIFK